MSRTNHHGNRKKEELFGKSWHWCSNEPKWWISLVKHRPKRQQERMCISSVELDPEAEVTWPLDKKPWIYYW